MVGKKSSLGILKAILIKEGIPKQQIFTTVFAQGVTYRWGLAWTFLPEAAAAYQTTLLLTQQPHPISSEENKITQHLFQQQQQQAQTSSEVSK
jgi:hypothetical protein